jgi:hypothetical protein
MPSRRTALFMSLTLAAFGVACGGEGPSEDVEAIEKGAKAMEEEIVENVERSAETYEETYEEARKKGESAVEAGGEAYNAVQDLAEEEKKKASP